MHWLNGTASSVLLNWYVHPPDLIELSWDDSFNNNISKVNFQIMMYFHPWRLFRFLKKEMLQTLVKCCIQRHFSHFLTVCQSTHLQISRLKGCHLTFFVLLIHIFILILIIEEQFRPVNCSYGHSYGVAYELADIVGFTTGHGDRDEIIFTFPLQVFKWTFTFEMLVIASWTHLFKPRQQTYCFGGPMSTPGNNVVCLLTFVWRWAGIVMTLNCGIWRFGCS